MTSLSNIWSLVDGIAHLRTIWNDGPMMPYLEESQHPVYWFRCDLFAQLCMNAEAGVQYRAGNKEGASILIRPLDHLQDGCNQVSLEAHKRRDHERQIADIQCPSSVPQ